MLLDELFSEIFSVFNKFTKRNRQNISSLHNKVTSPFEFKTKNVVLPDNRTEKEIKALYAEIRILQAKNREKAYKKRFNYL